MDQSHIPLPVCHDDILAQLLDKIEEVNFREKLKIQNDQKPSRTQIRIAVVQYVINAAKKNNSGFSERNFNFYLYNGAYWKIIEHVELRNFLGQASSKMKVNWVLNRDYKFREELLRQCISDTYVAKIKRSKNESVLINLLNGTYEIAKDRNLLREFDSRDFLTYQLPFNFDPSAKAPKFEKFLQEVLPDKNSQLVLSEFLASSFLTNDVLKLEKALLLYGSGANGKSVIYEIVLALFGNENITNYSLANLMNESGYYRAKIGDSLINYASEIQGKIQSNVFKQLASGEPIDARHPYSQPFIIENYAKLIFNCNELPPDVEQTTAYFRRFIILPFNVTIAEENQDKELAKKLFTELPGIFNWLLSGLDRLLDQKGFTSCEASDEAVLSYKRESDTVYVFLSEQGYEPHLHINVSLKGLFEEYLNFCKDNGYRNLSISKFSAQLQKLQYSVKRVSSGRIVYAEKNDLESLTSTASLTF